MKKLLLVMLVVCMIFPLFSAAAEEDALFEEMVEEEESDEPVSGPYGYLSGPADYVPAEPNPDAKSEDFIGEWKAIYRTIDGQIEYNTDIDECAAVTEHGVFFTGGYASFVITMISLKTFGGEVKGSFRNGAYFCEDKDIDASITTELLQDNMLKVTIVYGGEETILYYMRTAEEYAE